MMKTIVNVLVATLLMSLMGYAKENVLFNLDFEEMLTGSVDGCDQWSVMEGTVCIRLFPEVGKVISSDGTKGDERQDLAVYVHSVPFGIKEKSRIAVEFDLTFKSEYGTALLGIGDAFANPPVVMGVLSGDIFTRSYGNHRIQEKAVDEDGVPVELPANQWYRIRCELDFSADTGVMAIRSISDGEESFRPVYFDKLQRKRDFSLGLESALNSGEKHWSGLYFRFSQAEGSIDNIRVIQL